MTEDDFVEVYRAYSGSHAAEVLQLLAARGIEARVMHAGGSDRALRAAKVSIVVASAQVEEAARVLAHWEHAGDAAVEQHARAARPVLFVIALCVFGIALGGIFADLEGLLIKGMFFGLLGLVAVACLRSIRRSTREPPTGHCMSCGYNLRGNRSGRCPECGAAIRPSWEVPRE
jgi:hypothetical protein